MGLSTDLINIGCPYCGAYFDAVVDASAGDQEYIEDCYVCCQPIVFVLMVDQQGLLHTVSVKREDDA